MLLLLAALILLVAALLLLVAALLLLVAALVRLRSSCFRQLEARVQDMAPKAYEKADPQDANSQTSKHLIML